MLLGEKGSECERICTEAHIYNIYIIYMDFYVHRQ